MIKEEKIALETLKEVASDDFDTLGDDISPKMAKNILNLIEKQQKEIEDLKVIADDIKDHRIVYIDTPEFEEKFISKDKIRELIKKYQEKAEDVKQKYKGVYAYKDDYLEALAKIEGYQELLEEN